jgi:uncharacterized membrane protein YkoI
MNSITYFRKRNVLVAVTLLIVSLGVSALAILHIQDARAQTRTNTTGSVIGVNKPNMTVSAFGPNITGSISLGNMIAKNIESQVHVTLVNASTIAEKTVGANAHAISVRIGVVHGFLVYIALVVDSNYGFHTVLVDARNGKVLSSVQMSTAAGKMIGPGTGMMFGQS